MRNWREGIADRREVKVHMQTRFMVAVLVAMVTAVAGSGREATSVVAAQSGSCEALAGLKLTVRRSSPRPSSLRDR